jgi:hypothetical protein
MLSLIVPSHSRLRTYTYAPSTRSAIPWYLPLLYRPSFFSARPSVPPIHLLSSLVVFPFLPAALTAMTPFIIPPYIAAHVILSTYHSTPAVFVHLSPFVVPFTSTRTRLLASSTSSFASSLRVFPSLMMKLMSSESHMLTSPHPSGEAMPLSDRVS